MIIKREELYEKLKEICPGKYSIGLHGISVDRIRYFYNDENTPTDELSDTAAKQIVENGLRVEHNRSINGTVQFFGRLDSKDDLKAVFDGLSYYYYGSNKDYIIVATPIEIKKDDETSLYIGKTNLDSAYKKYFDTKGSEISSLSDHIILNRTNIIDPKFILGRFKILEDGNIELIPNEKHISKQNSIVSDEEFNQYKQKVNLAMPFDCLSLYTAFITRDISLIKKYLPVLMKNKPETAFILETITQLLNEENIQDLTNEELKALEELKETYKEIQEKNKRYYEEKQKYLESLKSYTLEQIQEFALNNPYSFNDFPKEIREDLTLMRELTKTPGLRPILLSYLGENIRNDETAMVNLVNNCSDEYFDYIGFRNKGKNQSDLIYQDIGLDVRTSPLFWDSLNMRIQQLRATGYEIPYFDTEKELRIANEKKEAKKNITQ